MIILKFRVCKTPVYPRVTDDDLLKCHYDFYPLDQSLNVEELEGIDAGLRASARCTFVYTNGSCHPFASELGASKISKLLQHES